MLYLTIYLTGVVIALAVMRDPLKVRIATALVWPLGPIAFIVVLAIMLTASVLLWPLPVLGSVAVVLLLGWLVF